MNLITVITSLLLVFGLSDLLTEKYPRVQRGVFGIAILVTWFLFTIKYYYGPDIWHYVPHYNEIPSVSQIFSHQDELQFEIGYEVFCSILKHAGVSFYWMTAIVSTFYFFCVYLLYRNIHRKQSFALMILVILDFNLIFAAYRQCLSVSFFILLVLAIKNRKYFWAIVAAFFTVVFHKAGGFVVGATLIAYLTFYFINHANFKPWVYELILVLLAIMLLLPMTSVTLTFIHALPLPSSYIQSIIHHLGLGRQIQTVFIVYAMAVLCIAYYVKNKQLTIGNIAVFVVTGLAIVVVLYQYFYLLNRMRSYFIPVVIYFLFTAIQEAEDMGFGLKYGKVLKQMTTVIVYVFLTHSVVTFTQSANKLHNHIYNFSTVFDLRNARKSDIQHRQMMLAFHYWQEDFMKDTGNKVLHD